MAKFFDGQVYFNSLPTHKRNKKHLWSVIAILVFITILITLMHPDWVVLLPWYK